MLQALFDAAVGHAERGENMAYALYAAAKLQRPDDACRLWQAMQPCVQIMSLRDVFNVLWACARLQLGATLDLTPALHRLEQLLVESGQARWCADSDSSSETDPFLAAANAHQSPSDRVPPGIPGWLIAQIAWSLAEMKLEVKEEVAERLFNAVRCVRHVVEFSSMWRHLSSRQFTSREIRSAVFHSTSVAIRLRQWACVELAPSS